MQQIFRFTLLCAVFFSSCKKVVTAELDKQITLYFPVGYWNTNNTDLTISPEDSYLTDFDKRDYINVDSITFNVGLSLEDRTDTVYVGLFDMTNHKEIENSYISATNIDIFNSDTKEVQSLNLFKYLPDEKITLAIVARSVKGKYVYIDYPYLKLRRN